MKWENNGDIAAVIDFDGNAIREEFDNLNKWVYQPRIIGTKVKKVQMFFTVQTQKTIFELVQKEIKFLEENKLSITKKVTGMEHTRKIRFITETYLKIASADWYHKLFE